ncbi:prominin-2 [Astyanax mexicanus]|uniref:prominin-2 n=1 Tax=Astyanax mexicanus TaxID=7994 RepID=UPI0020CB137E|nr:prominin-2 [Astyanax mexicanus]
MGTGMRRKLLGVFSLLLLFIGPCTTTHPYCPAKAAPPDINGPANGTVQQMSLDGSFLSQITHSFLRTVQPNPFPKDLLSTISNSRATTETIQQVLRYEIGFLVCVAIGILYILLMPLIGFCFACCRCCGNCGGRMYQKQTRKIHCKRRFFYWATWLVTLIILAGNVCMFLSNKYTGDGVRNGVVEVDNTLQNLQKYVTTIPKQIDQVVNESFVTVDEITCHVNGSGFFIGEQIQNGLKAPVMSALDSVTKMAQVLNSTSLLLLDLNSTQLQAELNALQANLTSVKNRINDTLRNPNCLNCNLFQSQLDSLSLDTSLNLSFKTDLQSAVNQAERANLNAQIQNGKDFFDSIPQVVTNETRDNLQGVQSQLQDIKSQVSQVTTDLPLDQLTSISDSLKDGQRYTKEYTSTVQNAEYIRWSVALVLCCLILLVVVCNLLGLLLGPAGLRPKSDPTNRSSTANCGGLFLMAGVGFSFLFSWIFMIIVLILFVVFGNTYTLLCVPWQSRELFQLIETPDLIPGFNLQLSQSLGLKANLTVTEIYNDCQMDKSLWNTLHLAETFDLNDLLNVSKYKVQVMEAFESAQISIPNITLLNSGTESQLRNFSATASSVNFTSIIERLNTFSKINLGSTADGLDKLADNQTNITVKDELRKEANDLRSIQTYQINLTINPLLWQLKSKIERIRENLSQINSTVGDVLQNVSYAQNFLNNNATQVLKSKTSEFIDDQLGILTAFTTWANLTITEQVGRCRPVAAAVNTAENLICAQLVDSLNAFWFSLGWCMVFLIPSIIFSVKLAKFYRRMKFTDVYENHIVMDHIPRANLKQY